MFLGLVACQKDDVTITASFDSELVAGKEYKFTVTTEDYESVTWLIEGQTYSESEVVHEFSDFGSFEVKLTVTTSNHDGSAVSDEVTQTVTIAERFQTIKISTKFGDIRFYLYQSTPLHHDNFLKLAGEDFYDGTTFHRIIDDFMIQGGDPNSKDGDPSNDGQGGPGYQIDAEFNPKLTHVQGAVAAARTNNPEKRSSGSQFYIVEDDGGEPGLDGQYTVFGIVFDGIDVVSEIAQQPKASNDRPIDNITMNVDIVWYTPAELKSQFDFDIPVE